MLEAWLKRTRDWLSAAEQLLLLPEQEFAGWAIARSIRSSVAVSSPQMVTTICGETGSGKSSLLRQALRPIPGTTRRKILVAESVEWAHWLTETAERGPTVLNWETFDLLVCENLQRVADPHGDGERLASWLDQAREHRIPVIITATCLPSQIDRLSPRLVNRLQGGLLAGIRPLGTESQQRLWQHWCTQRAMAPAPRNLEFDPFVTTAGQLRHKAAQQSERSSKSMPDTDIVSLELVAEAVARDFQVPVSDLCSGSRLQSLKIPRGVAMSLARELTRYPLKTISRHFGCRSHTSVVRSCSRLQQLLPEAPSLRQQVQELRAKLRCQMSAECG